MLKQRWLILMDAVSKINVKFALFALLSFLTPLAVNAKPGLQFEFEGGSAWSSRNDARVPGETGTKFDLSDFGAGPFFYYRLSASVILSKKHEIRALFAPFSTSGAGLPDQSISFQGQTFSAGQDTTFDYTFNSYRLSYIYHFLLDGPWRFRLGFTNKIRDAEISLKNTGVSASKSNVGYVPLIHLGGQYRFTEKVFIDLDLDALAAPQGRAEDLALRLGYRLLKGFDLLVGYRMLEGGADNKEVYTFAWFHYLSGAIRYSF